MNDNRRKVKDRQDPASRQLTPLEIHLYDKLRQAVRHKPELDLATRFVTARERNWPRVYGAVLEIEKVIGQTLSDAGFLSNDERNNLIASSFTVELMRKNQQHGISIEASSPQPLTLEHAYVLLAIALSKAFTADVGSDASG